MSPPALASSSRVRLVAVARAAALASRRGYAAPPNPNDAGPGDSRLDVIRSVLYPPDSVAPTSASPVGARHKNHTERLSTLLPSAEAHETIERAWALFRRRERERRDAALTAKYDAMVDACAELDAITAPGAPAALPRDIYDRAMVRMYHAHAAHSAAAQGIAQGKKKTQESRFLENRPEGLVPREAWVPTETRGKGWNYEWQRPLNE